MDKLLLRSFEKTSRRIVSLSFSDDGNRILSYGAELESEARVWDADTGKLLLSLSRSFLDNPPKLSRDGSRALEVGPLGSTNLYDVESGKLISGLFTGRKSEPADLEWGSFSPDGKKVLWIDGGVMELFDVISGKLLNSLSPPGAFKGQYRASGPVRFSPDGKRVFTGGNGSTFMISDLQPGSAVKILQGPMGYVVDIDPSPDGKRVLSGGSDGKVRIWDAETGALLHIFNDHSSSIRTVMFVAGGKRVLSIDDSETAKIWDAETGIVRGTFVGDAKGTVLLTPAGFFRSEGLGNTLLAIVDGYQPYKIDQFYQALYRPDLVEEYFNGDPNGKYAKAAGKLNLRRLIDSGRPPEVTIEKTDVIGKNVMVTVRLTDRGGGVGKVEWRVDGKTQGVERGAQVLNEGQDTVLTRMFAVGAQRNVISVTAYNSAELVASPSAEAVIDTAGATIGSRGTLFILAIGVDKYRDKSRQLKNAAADAKAIGDALTVAGKTTYDLVKPLVLKDQEVTDANLDKIFSQLALAIKPNDKFVFFLAGHGLTVEGKYYFLPQDFEKGDTYASKGIDQDRWQEWFARIQAGSSVLLYDTCEAGSLARNVSTEKAAAMDRLGQATGINVIAASDADQPAGEGYNEHGIFTWALLDAFANGDQDQNDQIEIFELANYVGDAVRRISLEEYGIEQRPRFKLLSNFPLGLRTSFLTTPSKIDTTPTHVLMESVTLGGLSLEAGTEVYIIKDQGEQVFIGAEGTELGLISTRLLLKKKKLRAN